MELESRHFSLQSEPLLLLEGATQSEYKLPGRKCDTLTSSLSDYFGIGQLCSCLCDMAQSGFMKYEMEQRQSNLPTA